MSYEAPISSALARLSDSLSAIAEQTDAVRNAACDLQAMRERVENDYEVGTSIVGISLRGVDVRKIAMERMQDAMSDLGNREREAYSAMYEFINEGGERPAYHADSL